MTTGTRPFANVRILDFTQVLAGPYGSYQLALLGADVIKVERREGEDMRRTPLSREWAERGMAPSWLAINGNKRRTNSATAWDIVLALPLRPASPAHTPDWEAIHASQAPIATD